MAPVDVHAKGDCKLTIDWDREFSKAKVTLNYKANNGKQQRKNLYGMMKMEVCSCGIRSAHHLIKGAV